MGQIEAIIKDNESSTRKTQNNDLYYKILCAICEDESYHATVVKAVNEKGVVTEDMNLAGEFRKLLATCLKKNTTMTEVEAFEAAENFKLTADQARTLANIVHESDYVTMKDCHKKVKLINKPGLDVTLSIGRAPESIRPNPQDRTKSVKIEAHDRLIVQQKIFDFQKKVIKNK